MGKLAANKDLREITTYFAISAFFLVLCLVALYSTSDFLLDETVSPKWNFSILVILFGIITYCFMKLCFTGLRINSAKVVLLLLTIIALSCFSVAIHGMLQFFDIVSSHGKFKIKGSFDNPAGFAVSLCAGFPVSLYFIKKQELLIKYIAIFSCICIIAAIILSGSRAGIISSISILCCYFFKYPIKLRLRYIFVFICILISMLATLYLLRKDSVTGRFLIWNCTLEMIKSKPIIGYGTGGFRANYMNFQAKYFYSNPDSDYKMIADNVKSPFNEYLLLLTNYGIMGFAFFIMITIIIIRLFRKYQTEQGRIAMLCLISIAIFSCFSYPLSYPFVWIVLLTSVFIILSSYRFPALNSLKKEGYIIIIVIIVIAYFSFKHRLEVELQWASKARSSLKGQSDDLFNGYDSLYPYLKDNYLFLYNYAAELNYYGFFDESLIISKRCSKLWADYDLQLVIASNYFNVGQYAQSEIYYKTAAYMCPNRFVPLWGLLSIYKTTNNKLKAIEVADRILKKDIKVPSQNVNEIKGMAKEYLKAEKIFSH